MSTFEAVPRAESPNRISRWTGGWMIEAREMRLGVIALVALAGLGTGIFATATRPQTTFLHHEVTSLTGALNSDHRQLMALRSSVTAAASQGIRLQGDVRSLHRRVGSLQGTTRSLQYRVGTLQGAAGLLQHRVGTLGGNVAELQSSDGQLRAQSSRLLTCVPQLQQELHSLTVRSAKFRGWLKSASLANPTIVSKGCTKTLFGL